MKQPNLIIVILFCLLAVSCQVNYEKEKETIISVIENERDAYFEGDLEKINGTWLHDSLSRKTYYNPDGSKVVRGWDELSEENEYNLREDRGDYSGIEASYANYEIEVAGRTATVYHNAVFEGLFDGDEISVKQERMVHLVKVNGDWKIDQMNIHQVREGAKTLVSNGMVCGWNYILKDDVQTEDFEKFMLDEFIPRFEKHYAGVEMILLKGERGENTGRFRVMLILDSVDERNSWWPEEGESSEKNAAASEKMRDLTDKFRTMVASGTYTDWLIL